MTEETLATCPRCDSSFTVAAAQLSAAGGRVRCGNCLQIFDAITNELDFVPPPLPAMAPDLDTRNLRPMADSPLPTATPRRRGARWLLLGLLVLLALQLWISPAAEDPIDGLSLARLVVRPHPETPEALRVDAILRNAGDTPKPYPGLVLGFTNRQGEPRARRTFTAAEYLHGGRQPGLMPAHSEVQVSLSLANPGPDAVNYVAGLSSLPQLKN
ncbi:MAG: zinc-ribbon and DUF3426 domain-containing protein [Halieaceae bacterium]|nr:zinc-ribbon and DUF3426 domain-containing protein [Halieaceae bacterium]